MTDDAGLAQLVEQLIRNEQVTGSSPATSSSEIKASGGDLGSFLLYAELHVYIEVGFNEVCFMKEKSLSKQDLMPSSTK